MVTMCQTKDANILYKIQPLILKSVGDTTQRDNYKTIC